jgi:hypothetical protein
MISSKPGEQDKHLILTYRDGRQAADIADEAEPAASTAKRSIVDLGRQVNDASVVTADIACTNGVIHVIDTVLIAGRSLRIIQDAGSAGLRLEPAACANAFRALWRESSTAASSHPASGRPPPDPSNARRCSPARGVSMSVGGPDQACTCATLASAWASRPLLFVVGARPPQCESGQKHVQPISTEPPSHSSSP